MDENSTKEQYIFKFLNDVFIGLTDEPLHISDELIIREVKVDDDNNQDKS
jgi:hypothetical protein